jgi:hypothetical protein
MMPKYQVLIVSEEFREVEANSAEEAREVCFQKYCNNEYELDKCPSFICEEADLLGEDDGV